MRKLAFIAMSLVTFTACNNTPKNNESKEAVDQSKEEATSSIGGNKAWSRQDKLGVRSNKDVSRSLMLAYA